MVPLPLSIRWGHDSHAARWQGRAVTRRRPVAPAGDVAGRVPAHHGCSRREGGLRGCRPSLQRVSGFGSRASRWDPRPERRFAARGLVARRAGRSRWRERIDVIGARASHAPGVVASEPSVLRLRDLRMIRHVAHDAVVVYPVRRSLAPRPLSAKGKARARALVAAPFRSRCLVVSRRRRRCMPRRRRTGSGTRRSGVRAGRTRCAMLRHRARLTAGPHTARRRRRERAAPRLTAAAGGEKRRLARGGIATHRAKPEFGRRNSVDRRQILQTCARRRLSPAGGGPMACPLLPFGRMTSSGSALRRPARPAALRAIVERSSPSRSPPRGPGRSPRSRSRFARRKCAASSARRSVAWSRSPSRSSRRSWPIRPTGASSSPSIPRSAAASGRPRPAAGSR